MSHESYPDALIRRILKETRTIAVVGASSNTVRPAYFIFRYLQQRGFRMVGVNPALAGKDISGAPVYARLADIPEPVDMVDIFRNSEAAGGIVDEALALPVLPKVVWMQLTVRNDAAAARAEARGIAVVMNRCPKIEFGRLSGELGWAGVNSRVLSSKKPTLGDGVQRRGLGES